MLSETMTKENKGLTLVELLVVVGIIGLLSVAVVATINPKGRFGEAAEASSKDTVGKIATAMETCLAKNEGNESLCNTWSRLYDSGYVKLTTQPTGVVVGLGCVSLLEANSQYCKYLTSVGKVECNQAAACTPGV